MREMRWNQFEYAELDFYKDIDQLDIDFSESLAIYPVKSIRQFFWIERDYISPDLIKPVLFFNKKADIPFNIIFAIGLKYAKHFLKW